MSNKTSFEEWLNIRQAPLTDKTLASRIAFKAHHVSQQETPSVWRWLKVTFSEFSLPNPAYSLAVLLMIGAVAGFQTPVAEADDEMLDDISYTSNLEHSYTITTLEEAE